MGIIDPNITQKSALIGYTISLVRLSYFLGAFVSTPIMLGTVAVYGGSIAKYIMVAVGLAGSVFSLILMVIVEEKNTLLSFLVGRKGY